MPAAKLGAKKYSIFLRIDPTERGKAAESGLARSVRLGTA
jgi:hypothetical protein